VFSVFDEDGKFNPRLDQGSRKTIPCETVILAVGQAPDLSFMDGFSPETDADGPAGAGRGLFDTGLPGVFACGEIVNGPGSAIAAVASGHRAAQAVDGYLKGAELCSGEAEFEPIGPLPARVAEKVPRREREKMPVLSPEERKKSLLPYELGLGEAAALREAVRCLNCGLGAEVRDEKCVSCLTCGRACPYGVPVMEGHSVRMPVEGCQACGICAALCPAGAISVPVADRAAPGMSGLAGEKGGAVLFACHSACAGCPSLDRFEKAGGKTPVRVAGLPTTGALRLEWILKAFEEGAEAVFVAACADGRCRHAGGTAFVGGLVARARDLMARIGIAPERLSCIRPVGDEDLGELIESGLRRIEKIGK
ncbi:MAG TPA: hydrogenase iron-sulfur subunit, partial [Bacillota bacterium]|nr:hydrogenase iron-sulfur subunit [Bacillota bacterium]